ncbi:MAG: hypothetical protein JXA15_11210 [Spirochaetales bacterium]|nr:hypothetical protein [Spirochaetales bacterium]
MLTKLTLTIDRDVIMKAKSYARKRKRSVSRMVEDYLLAVSTADAAAASGTQHEGALTRSVTGMFRDEYKGQPYRELLEEALLENHA